MLGPILFAGWILRFTLITDFCLSCFTFADDEPDRLWRRILPWIHNNISIAPTLECH